MTNAKCVSTQIIDPCRCDTVEYIHLFCVLMNNIDKRSDGEACSDPHPRLLITPKPNTRRWSYLCFFLYRWEKVTKKDMRFEHMLQLSLERGLFLKDMTNTWAVVSDRASLDSVFPVGVTASCSVRRQRRWSSRKDNSVLQACLLFVFTAHM